MRAYNYVHAYESATDRWPMVSQIATGLAEFLTFFYTACVIRKRCRHLTWCCGDTMSGCIEKVSQTTKHQFSLKITALCTNVEDGITKIGKKGLRRWIRRDFVYPSLNFQAFQFKPANFQKFAKFRYLQDPAQKGVTDLLPTLCMCLVCLVCV